MKKPSLLDPDQAWSLLEKLNQLAEELWETHRDAFVKQCQENVHSWVLRTRKK